MCAAGSKRQRVAETNLDLLIEPVCALELLLDGGVLLLVLKECAPHRLDLLLEDRLLALHLGEVLGGDLGIVLEHVVLAGLRVELQQLVEARAVGLAHLLGGRGLVLEQSMKFFAPGSSPPELLAPVKLFLKRVRLRR